MQRMKQILSHKAKYGKGMKVNRNTNIMFYIPVKSSVAAMFTDSITDF